MTNPKPMDHLPVFEKLGEAQVQLQFSHREGDVGREARAWLHGHEEARAKSRHAELLAEIKRPHWSITPSFWLLVAAVIISVLALMVAVFGLPQAQQLLPLHWQSQSSTTSLQTSAPSSTNITPSTTKR